MRSGNGFYKKRCSRLLLWLPLLLILLTGCRPAQPNNPPPLRVTFLDVGQGDSAVIETPNGKVVVIDGGGHPGTDERLGDDPGNRTVVPFLRSHGISVVDMIVPTHPDDDHVQGLIAVVEQLGARSALINGYPGESGPYNRLLARLKARNVPIHAARRGQQIDLGNGAILEILHPTDTAIQKARSFTNANSIVLRLVYGKSRILFTGDADDAAEESLLRSGIDLSADVLKVGHHGSRFSTNAPFLAKVSPTAAVISVGRSNVYGHPNREVLNRLAARNVRVYRTDQQGAITLETDGEKIRITGFR